MIISRRAILALAATVALAASACSAPTPGASPSSGPSGSQAAPGASVSPGTTASESASETLEPASYGERSAEITNAWLPLKPGTKFRYDGSARDGQRKIARRIELVATGLTKVVAGITTRAVWVVDSEDGSVTEKKISFYAQAADGTVWYLGEHPETFDDNEFAQAHTWLHGVADAKAGIAMPANPHVTGDSFSQGWAPAVDFMDRGRVVAQDQKVCLQGTCYEPVVVIEEFSAAEPDAAQVKSYARDVGLVQVGWRGNDREREELQLTAVTTLSAKDLSTLHAAVRAAEAHAYIVSKAVYGDTPPLV